MDKHEHLIVFIDRRQNVHSTWRKRFCNDKLFRLSNITLYQVSSQLQRGCHGKHEGCVLS